jgi:hypothetical protein
VQNQAWPGFSRILNSITGTSFLFALFSHHAPIQLAKLERSISRKLFRQVKLFRD